MPQKLHTHTKRQTHRAHKLPLQPARSPCSPLATCLRPARRLLSACSPPLRPACRPCGPLAAPKARSPPCSPLAACLRPARHLSAACSPPDCGSLAALATRLPLARGPLAALAARSPPACGPLAAPGARTLPACGLLATPAARLPLARGLLAALAARLPPPCDPLAAPAARLPHACGQLAAPCSPRAALLQPMCHHLQPARRPSWPARRLPSGSPLANPSAASVLNLLLALSGYCPSCSRPAMASLSVLTFDHEGRLIQFEGDCYRCFPPDPGIETAALGAGEAAALGASTSASSGTGESALSGTASASASRTFTLDSGASRSFFRDRTTLTPLGRPVAVSLADPSGGPVLAHFSTVLPCPAAPSGTLSGLYLPSFSTNLVSGADLQDAGVHQFTPASQRVTHCTDARSGRHLATFTRRPGSSLYTLTTESSPVPVSGQVAASSHVLAAASRSGPESAPCSCRLLSHETLLWHHRLGHPSLLRLRSMASRVLVSGLPRSLPRLPPGPGPTCVPCVEGRQRATPHSSQFPPTEAPLHTLHMDVWGPARVRGQGHERYFLLVVDDYSRYTTVFPLRSKGDVTEVLIDWIRAACIRQTFTLSDSPQQNGIAERRIGMVMDVARTSMMHAAAPHFLWPFAVRYAAHQINLQPRVSMPETSPALLWTGKVGDASTFRVWGSRAFVRDLSTDKLSPRAAPCVFLGFPPDAPGWQFYHPTSRRVLSSQDVTFDESVPYYRLFPYRTLSLPPPPLFLVPGLPPVDPLPPQGPAPSSVSQVDAVEPAEVTGDTGAAEGAEPGGA
ncbi:unnamed protein product, partial [Closterium sp. NIES-54]